MMYILLTLPAAALAALVIWRVSDIRAERKAWRNFLTLQPPSPRRFDPSTVSDLPEPVRRFFCFAIEPGAPIFTVAEIEMTGELGLGSRQKPGYRHMTAKEILAPPHGFVWSVRMDGGLRVAGSDGAAEGSSWSRFWLCGIVPVGRAGANRDHLRSSFGRYVAEAVFWAPAALLPGEHANWEATGNDSARLTVTGKDLEQAIDLELDPEGRPIRVSFQRWSNANPEKVFRFQPFGGCLSEFREFGGYRLPTRIEAGNFFGTDDYFPFFRINVRSVRFPQSQRPAG